MITSLPRLKEHRGSHAGEILPRLASDRRKKIPQVGKVFPKTLVQEQVDEKLDFHCVGLEKDKNVLFPTVEVEGKPSSPKIEERERTPVLELLDVTEVTLPELPSVLGSRRGSSIPSPAETPEPPDLLVKGESQKKSQTQVDLDTSEPEPDKPPEEVMRSNLEPLIDQLFEEDELFAQDFEEDGLNRVLFIRKMGIYVEIKTKEYIPGVVCTPLFHCPRCKDHWTQYGTVPENCPFKRQPTRGPAIHLASYRKRRVDYRKRKTKRRLGDIKEGFIVSGSGTVLNQIDENYSEDNRSRASLLRDAESRDYLTSDDVVLEDLKLGVIDSATKMEAFKVLHIDGKMTDEEYIRGVAEALGFNEEQYNKFARVNINMEINISGAGLDGKTSVISRLDLSMLDSMTVKDLPEKIREKLLSMLRLQRQRRRRQKQALANKKKSKRKGTEVIDGDTDEEAYDEDAGDSILHSNRRNSTVKTNKKRRDSQGKQGKLHGDRGSMEDVSDDRETAGRRGANGQNASRVSSSLILDSDEEFSASRSPSDVLAYKEKQSRRHSRQKNAAVKNRTGQPDTPFQRLGRHPMSKPANSSSFFSYDDGDSDEENWGRGWGPRVGSSRAHRSDSYTSYMSEMARGGHVTDSRTSMIGKYSRTMGSARARKDVSFSNDQMSHGSLGNGESIDDVEDDPSDPRSNRARRQSRKKEKGDGVKRPGRYHHSKVIDTMGHVTASSGSSHVMASFGDTSMMYGSKARLSHARISLIDANIPSPRDSTPVIKRSSRPSSVKEPQKKNETIETECPPHPSKEQQEDMPSCSESMDDVPPLEAAVTQISGTTSPTQAHEKSPEEKPKTLFKRTFQEKIKSLVSVEDLNVIHRLPVSSAFTFSFYELPNQHREHNQSIKKAAGRIGRRKKKESGHFRSKSAP